MCQSLGGRREATLEAFEHTLTALRRRRLLIVSGKGGVGRTTAAALLGRALAREGRRVLVGTTGTDDRLARMMGLPNLGSTPVSAGGGLYVQRLDPAVCLREYGELVLRSGRLARAVFDNGVVRGLLRAIPGLDDFAVLGKVWHEAVRAQSYDHLIFDGPASGHLLLSLSVPGAILRTVPAGPLRSEAALVDSALRDPMQCCAVLVTLAESWPLKECDELQMRLQSEIGLFVGAVVVNRSRRALSTRAASRLHTAATELESPGLRCVAQRAHALLHEETVLKPWEERWSEQGLEHLVRVPTHIGAIASSDDLADLLERAGHAEACVSQKPEPSIAQEDGA